MVKSLAQVCQSVRQAYLSKKWYAGVMAWWNMQTLSMRSRLSTPADNSPIMLVGHPYYCNLFKKFGDDDVGGLSQGAVTYDITPEFGVVTEFVGEVNGETSHKMYGLPFISFTAAYSSRLNVIGNGVRIIIRRVPVDTESVLQHEKMLPIQVQVDSALSLGFVDEFTATICPTTEWRAFELPLTFWSRVRASGSNIQEGLGGEEEGEVPQLGVKGVTFMVRSQKSRPFRFQIASVEMVTNPLFYTLQKVFPKRPVFFEALTDYSKARVQDYRL